MDFRSFIEMSDNWWNGMVMQAKGGGDADAFYDKLTMRDSPDVLDQQYKQHGLGQKEGEYEQLVAQIASKLKSQGFEITDNGWLHVEMPVTQRWGSNYSDKDVPVDASKIYRTFTPVEGGRITNYLKALEGFAGPLKQLQDDPKYQDRIQYKFPSKLRMLYQHPDSLVVHFRNTGNRQRIDQLIDQYFAQAGIKWSDRGIRATAGYDFRGKDSEGGGSHSQLIARAVEKFIKSNPQIKTSPDPQVRQSLEQWIAYFNKLPPNQLWKYLQS